MAKTDEISEGYDFIPRLDKKREKAAAKAKKRKEEGAEDFKGILGDDSSDSEMVREIMIDYRTFGRVILVLCGSEDILGRLRAVVCRPFRTLTELVQFF